MYSPQGNRRFRIIAMDKTQFQDVCFVHGDNYDSLTFRPVIFLYDYSIQTIFVWLKSFDKTLFRTTITSQTR
jgi:hypothetical protein